MNKCKNCGAEFEGKFCPQCGTPLPQEETGGRAAHRERDAKKPADPYGEEAVCSHIRTVIRLKKFSFFFLIGLITGPAIVVLWPMAIVHLFKKPNVKKETETPSQFFRQNRGPMIAYATLNAILCVLLTILPILVPILAVRMELPSVPVWSRASLQVGGLLCYLPPSIATPVGVAMFLIFGTFTALCIVAAVYCKKAPDGIAFSERPISDMREQIAKARNVSRTRILARTLPCMLLADLLVAAIAISVIVKSNIFTVDKLAQVNLGATQDRVESVLGGAEEKTANEWYYYSDNVLALNKRERALEAQFEEALESEDEARLEQIMKESEKIDEERKNMQYVTIRVLFDAKSEVTRLELFDGETGIPTLEPSQKMRTTVATLSSSRISLSEAADFLSGETVTYTAIFSDNDVVIDRLTGVQVYSDRYYDRETEMDHTGTYYLQWTDLFGICRAVVEVV